MAVEDTRAQLIRQEKNLKLQIVDHRGEFEKEKQDIIENMNKQKQLSLQVSILMFSKLSAQSHVITSLGVC
jgi:hypothetical protein